MKMRGKPRGREGRATRKGRRRGEELEGERGKKQEGKRMRGEARGRERGDPEGKDEDEGRS